MPRTSTTQNTAAPNVDRPHSARSTWRRPLLAFAASFAASTGIPLVGGIVDRALGLTFHGFGLWPLYADYALGLLFGILVGVTLLILRRPGHCSKRHLLTTRAAALVAATASLLLLASLNEYAILAFGILMIPSFTWTFIAIGIFAVLLVSAAAQQDAT